jgi:hypothetical protein
MNHRFLRSLLAAALLTGLGACKRQEITVYTAPKEKPEAAHADEPGHEGHGHGTASKLDTNAPVPPKRAELPKVTWKLPVGWSETGPGQMSMASFAIKSDIGQAGATITPLPNMGGQEAMIVNMWRQQAGAPDLPPAEAEAALTPIAMAGGTGKFFEINSERNGKKSRIVTAMLTRGQNTWFFKLAGDDAVVEAQKPAFLEFLKSIEFDEKAVAAVTNPPEPPATEAPSQPTAPTAAPLEAPETWRTLPAGQMQVAKFAVPDQGEAKAEVAVSMFSSDTGGTAANISRWRRQMGMPEISEAEAGALAKPLEGVEKGLVADLQHEKRRMIGAIVQRESGWWFYKLMGDEAAVAAARESFLNFAKSQPKS